MPGSFAAPQLGQMSESGAPQPPQNFLPGAFSNPQCEQALTGGR